MSKGGYQRLRRGCLSHRKIRPLSIEAKLVWWWAVSEGGLTCIINASIRQIALKLHDDYPDTKVKRGLLELQVTGHILWDKRRELVWLIEGLDEQADFGPALAPAVRRRWDELPPCAIKQGFAKRYPEWLAAGDPPPRPSPQTLHPDLANEGPPQGSQPAEAGPSPQRPTRAQGRTTPTPTTTSNPSGSPLPPYARLASELTDLAAEAQTRALAGLTLGAAPRPQGLSLLTDGPDRDDPTGPSLLTKRCRELLPQFDYDPKRVAAEILRVAHGFARLIDLGKVPRRKWGGPLLFSAGGFSWARSEVDVLEADEAKAQSSSVDGRALSPDEQRVHDRLGPEAVREFREDQRKRGELHP